MSIRLNHVFYRYKTKKDYSLRDVTFNVDKGEFALVAGPTGSGKSTLAYLLTGIAQSYFVGELKGEIFVDGKRINGLRDTVGVIGYVFQSFENQLLNFSVKEELMIAPLSLGLNKREIEKTLNHVGELLDIKKLFHRYVYNLSSGEMQKVAIASMLTGKPKILFLDEPFSQLDDKSIENLIQELVEMNKEGLTIVVVEHRIMKLIDKIDKIVLLNRGEIIYEGDPRGARRHLELLGLRTNPIEKRIKEKIRRENERRTIVSVRNLWVDRDGNRDVLKGLSFNVNAGEIVSFYGPNGSGKTTLALTLLNVINKKLGSIKIHGDSTMVFQCPDQNLIYDTVFEEVYNPALNSGMSKDEARVLAKNLLEKFGLTEYLNESPLLLSKGEKYRLAIASAIASKPDLLILDEPTYGQDFKGIEAIFNAISHLIDRGNLAVIINTNDKEVAEAFSDKVFYMENGEIRRVEKLGGAN
ncbi:MAG: ABC transporter ATP-binding protein [Candidatus Njordarchaeia archaeon]